MNKQFSWIVGVDFLGRAGGAMAFARWLHANSAQQRFVGVHVIPEHPALEARDLPAMCDTAEAYTRKLVHEAEASGAFTELRVIHARRAEEGLEAALVEHGGRGLIIGRRSPGQGKYMIALGPVARRLVRRAHGPIIVVPRDLEAELVDCGPILLATDATETSAPALEFARRMADLLARRLILAYVVPSFDNLNLYTSGAHWGSVRLGARERGAAELRLWARAHGLVEGDAVQMMVLDGPIETELLATAEEERAAMIVSGARRLSLAERMFTSSVGTGLAARSPVPVAIVPHDHVPELAEVPEFTELLEPASREVRAS